jgi:mannose-6-phosphate isomerase-like protein (cupin superfamily)
MTGYVGPIEKQTTENTYFRQVLFTGPHSQLVVMCLRPGEDIGDEVHPHVDQFFRIEKGQAKFVLNEKEEHTVRDGDAVVVPAGTYHNVINTSKTLELKLYTIYVQWRKIISRVTSVSFPMGIDAGLWIMACQKKPDMLMVSTRGCCCSRNVKNAGSRKLPSIALLRTTLGGLPFRNRHSARPALHLLLRLHAVERLCLSSAMKPRRNSPRR